MDNDGAGENAGALPDGGAAGGTAGAGDGAAGAGAAASTFDRGKLHPALRDMTPENITSLFEDMATTIRTIERRPAAGAEDVSGVPAHARPAPRVEPPAPLDKAKLKTMFDPESPDFDPEGAVRQIADKNYSRLFGDLNARSIKGLFGNFRRELPDFEEYETEITEQLKARDPASLTEADILSTYFGVKGMKMTVKQRNEARAKATTTIPPSPPKTREDAGTEGELSPLEEEVARRMFRGHADPIKAYKEKATLFESGSGGMKVPVGGGKKE
jgi:hypothetical protein